MKIEVKPGILHVNSISLLRKEKGLILLDVAFSQKYPKNKGIGAMVHGDGRRDEIFCFGADENTIFDSQKTRKEIEEQSWTEIIVSSLPKEFKHNYSAIKMFKYSAKLFIVASDGSQEKVLDFKLLDQR